MMVLPRFPDKENCLSLTNDLNRWPTALDAADKRSQL